MKNLVKLIVSTALTLIMAIPTTVHAADYGTDAVGCNTYYFISIASKNTYTNWGPTVTAVNNTGTTQTSTYLLSRTQSSSFGISGTANIEMLFGSVGLTAEYKTEGSRTISFGYNLTVPAYTTYYARAGTQKVYGTARRYLKNSDCTNTLVNTFNYDYGYNYTVTWWQ